MAHKKFITPYMVKEGKVSFWHDDMKELLDALGITKEDNLNYALRRLPGRDDIERIKEFCDNHNINYSYSVEYDW